MSYLISEGQSFFDVVLQITGDIDRMGEVLSKTRSYDNLQTFDLLSLEEDLTSENVSFFRSKGITVVSSEQIEEEATPANALIDLDEEVLIDLDGEILTDLTS